MANLIALNLLEETFAVLSVIIFFLNEEGKFVAKLICLSERVERTAVSSQQKLLSPQIDISYLQIVK